MSTPQPSPLTARLYNLEYPRSLGVYSTYAEVQTVVDTLADHEFPVQHTMIVGTDLKLVERVTGRKTWGRVLGNGVLSGLWMGLFMGLLFVLLTNQSILMLFTTVLMGIIFFTVWSAVGYAMSGGKRDFTSMTATIPMQYELMVEHTHASAAREILTAHGPSMPAAPPRPHAGGTPSAPAAGGAAYGTVPGAAPSAAPPAPQPSAPAHRPTYGRPAPASSSAGPAASAPTSRPVYGRPADPSPAVPPTHGTADPAAPSPLGTPAHGMADPTASSPLGSSRPASTAGEAVPGSAPTAGVSPAPADGADASQSAPHRRSFGAPAGSPDPQDAAASPSASAGHGADDAREDPDGSRP
ncbi:general stress protein [Brachybacterium hainanense]|uniref:General stress protein n=1 Tax=Brachybacterium hainanense TaxID=1541174 RepID=A0ABV6RB68_9MICO